MSTPKRIAVGGSAANPPHIGHWALINSLLNCGLFDIVIWIVSGSRRDKKITVSADDRAQMTNLMLPKSWFTKPTKLIVQFRDVYWENTPTIMWLQDLAKQYPGVEINWFTGADSVIPKARYDGRCEIAARWVQGKELMAKWPFLVILRQGYPKPKNLPPNFSVLNIRLPNVSSSQVRDLITQGKSFEYLVTPAVAKYIKAWRLYGYRPRKMRNNG